MPSVTARMLWLQRLKSREVIQDGRRQRDEQRRRAREPGRDQVMMQQQCDGRDDDRHRAEHEDDPAGQRPAGARLAGHGLVIPEKRGGAGSGRRHCPAIHRSSFAFERGERQHAVLEQHLVERAHVELRSERGLGALAHVVPLHAAERVCEHEPRQAADEARPIPSPVPASAAASLRSAYASACSIVQPFTCMPRSSDHHGVIELIAADVVAVGVVEPDLVGEVLRVGRPAFARPAEEEQPRDRMIALAPVLREELRSAGDGPGASRAGSRSRSDVR